MNILDMLFTGIGVRLVSKVEVLVDNIELNCWREEKRERTTLIVAFDCGFLTQDNAHTFPILICRDSRYGQSGATFCERKGPTAYSIFILVGFIKDPGFRRIILKYDNEPSTKSLRDAATQACVKVEVIPQGPLEGDHMANGRVEMAVRKVKRQYNTGVRIADDSPLPQLASSFCSASHEQNENWQRWKNE